MQVLHLLVGAVLVCVSQAIGYDEFLSDLQYLYNIKELQDEIPLASYYPDETYGAPQMLDDKMNSDWQDLAYPDTEDQPAPKEPRDYGEAALRDQEYMKQLPLSGYQFISGGTGRQEDPSEVKTDKVLPAYCTPPNPCPAGYTGGDNCVKDFENSPENNRRLLEEQDCPCDAEHMLSCPPGKKTIDPKSGFVSDGMDENMSDLDALGDIDLTNNAFLSTNRKRQKFIVKRAHDVDSPSKYADILPINDILTQELDEFNPYLYGQSPKSVVKKMAPRVNK